MDRRQITTAVTMLLLIGILALGLVVGYQSLFKPLEGEPEEDASTCTTQQPGDELVPADVQVSVYNASTRDGLAGETLDALRERGFRRGSVGNAPERARVPNVQVWSSQKKDSAAKLVALQFGTEVKVFVKEDDLGPGVDVVVGEAFQGLVDGPSSIKVRQPVNVCISKQDSQN